MKVSIFGLEYEVVDLPHDFSMFANVCLTNEKRWTTPQGSILVSLGDLLEPLGKASNELEGAVLNRVRDSRTIQFNAFVNYLNAAIDNQQIVCAELGDKRYVISARKNKIGGYQVSFAKPTIVATETAPNDAVETSF